LVARLIGQRSRILVKVAGLAQQVQRYIGNGNVLLQHWPMSTPFAVALGEDEVVVGEVEEEACYLLIHFMEFVIRN
jgi:hypothetical protein